MNHDLVNDKQRYYYMDLLNIFATFSVVILHSSEFAFQYHPDQLRWYLSLFLQIIFISAVPIFFMLSGANLLNYRERYTTTQFVKKRFLRVVVPFLTWSCIWFLYYRFYSQRPLLQKSLVLGIMHDKIQPIFWYFYSLMGIYAIMPVISWIIKIKNRRLILASIFAWLILVGCVGYYYGLIQQPEPTLFTSIPLFSTPAFGYFLLGWYLKMFPPKNKTFYWLLTAGIASLLIMFVLTLNLSRTWHYTARGVYTVFGLFGIVYGASIFVIFQKLFATWRPSKRWVSLLKKLSSTSLGVYCIHEFFIFFIEDIFKLASGSYYHMVILPIIVYLVSVSIVLIFKRIPLLHYIF